MELVTKTHGQKIRHTIDLIDCNKDDWISNFARFRLKCPDHNNQKLKEFQIKGDFFSD